MKKYFKKAATILGSALMLGSTVALAAAATYPAPFVSGGVADVALVIGANAPGSTDSIAATNIGASLSGLGATGSVSTTDTTTGETIRLDSDSQRIYLNTSINTAKSTLTKTDLPTILADTSFSGNVEATITNNLQFSDGSNAADNNGKVIFAKQPTSSSEPIIGLSMGDKTIPLYNMTMNFNKEVALNHSDSEGETLNLFGKEFIISTETDGDTLVLFSSAQKVSLVTGGTSPNPSSTVTIDGEEYTIELVTGSNDDATIAVNGESKSINEGGSSKKVGGIDIAVQTVTSSAAISSITATLLVGTDKVTLLDDTTVNTGENDDPIDGTLIYFTGSDPDEPVGSLTAITISVFKPSSSDDVILSGETFTDPVFGGFKFDFVSMSSDVDDANRDEIIVSASSSSIDLEMTDSKGNNKVFTVAYNESTATLPYNFNLSDSSGNKIHVREMANISDEEYVILGNEKYGHLLQVTNLDNRSDYSKDLVTVRDVFSGENTNVVFTSFGTGKLTLDGKQYDVTFGGNDGDEWVQFKYPDSTDANTMVLYPTIETQKGAKVALVEPVMVDITKFDGSNNLNTINLPDGDGYTAVTLNWNEDDMQTVVTVSGTGVTALGGELNLTIADHTYNFTVGGVTYYMKSLAGAGDAAENYTEIGILNPKGLTYTNLTMHGDNADRPGILIWEEKDDGNDYERIYVELEVGDDDDTVNVKDLIWSSAIYSETSEADKKIEKEIDYWGTYAETDTTTTENKIVTIQYPDEQVYAKIYIGSEASEVTPGSGDTSPVGGVNIVPVYDNEVSSVSTNNLIVVGGSCINSVAAKLLGSSSPVCGADFTALTDVSDGQYMIQTFTSPYNDDKVAMLVAGYNAADTTKAGTYLRNNNIDTTKKYVGSTATEATATVVSE